MIHRKITAIFLVLFIFSGCALVVKDYEYLYGPTESIARRMDMNTTGIDVEQIHAVSYKNQIQPILNNRCVVCHSCNDAPCQLNLSSLEGLDRGWNSLPVYNAIRFVDQDPSRLGIDAASTAQWRKKAFFPVLNERMKNSEANLDNSLLYKMLILKRNHPMPTSGRLPASYGLVMNSRSDTEALSREQQCTSIEYFERYAEKHPEWGMPFGFPAIDDKEFKLLELWIREGGGCRAKNYYSS